MAQDGREIKMQNFLTKLWNDESGQDLVEYALLLVLIAVVVIAAVTALGNRVDEVFTEATDGLATPG